MPPSADKYAFRQPFKAVAALSSKTGTYTKPVDSYVEATIDYASKGYEVRPTTLPCSAPSAISPRRTCRNRKIGNIRLITAPLWLLCPLPPN